VFLFVVPIGVFVVPSDAGRAHPGPWLRSH
jgi:hypothetical protein